MELSPTIYLCVNSDKIQQQFRTIEVIAAISETSTFPGKTYFSRYRCSIRAWDTHSTSQWLYHKATCVPLYFFNYTKIIIFLNFCPILYNFCKRSFGKIVQYLVRTYLFYKFIIIFFCILIISIFNLNFDCK